MGLNVIEVNYSYLTKVFVKEVNKHYSINISTFTSMFNLDFLCSLKINFYHYECFRLSLVDLYFEIILKHLYYISYI
jgi:hypothetical protein